MLYKEVHSLRGFTVFKGSVVVCVSVLLHWYTCVKLLKEGYHDKKSKQVEVGEAELYMSASPVQNWSAKLNFEDTMLYMYFKDIILNYNDLRIQDLNPFMPECIRCLAKRFII